MNDLTVEEKKWTSKKELMDICQCSDKTLEQIITNLNIEGTFAIQLHMKKGGYHNLEVFYDDELVKAIQLKMKQNAMNAGGQRTENSIIKQSNIGDMAIGFVFTNGSYEQKMDMLALLQKQAEQQHMIEQQNDKLRIENQQLQQEAMDAYDKGYEEGRYRLNWMYRYDSLY